MQSETSEKIVSEQLVKLQKQKTTNERLRFSLIAIYGSLIKSKVFFDTNADLRPFVDKLPTNRRVKDYLLKARPQVIARMVSELSVADDAQLNQFVSVAAEFITSVSEHKAFTPDNNKGTTSDTKQVHKKKENYIDDLLNKYSRKSN